MIMHEHPLYLGRLSKAGLTWGLGAALQFLVLVLVLGLHGAAHADSIFGQSYYGSPVVMTDGRAAGRGGANLAYTDSISANVGTPTQLTDLKHLAISLTVSWGRTTSRDTYGQTERWDILNPTLRLGGRARYGFGWGVGFEARRSTHWTIVRDASSSPDPDNPVTETLEREGTLFDFPFEIGFKVFRHLRLGGGIILVRGTVRQRYSADVGGAGTSPADVREDTFQGEAFKLAVALQHLGPLSLAGVYVPVYSADVTVNQRGISPDSEFKEKRRDQMPARLQLGARLDLPGRWSMGSDYRWEGWSDYEGRETYTGQLLDEWSLHAGIELEEEGAGKRHKLPLRAGAWYRAWNYSLQGEQITEWGVSLGTAITLAGPFSRADLAVQYGKIGALDTTGADEEFIRLVLSITGGEKWY